MLQISTYEHLMKAKILASFKESSRRNNTIADMVQSLIISRKVSSTACALHFPGVSDIGSKLRRVERFYEHNYLSTGTAIDFLFRFKSSGKCVLIMDRTNWEYGDTDINYLAIYGVEGSRQSLVNVELLNNNGGSSNFEDRKLVIEPVIGQLGLENIEALLGDREFFSFEFIAYLLDKGLPFVIRIKENLHFIQDLIRQLKAASKTLRNQVIANFNGKDIVVDLSGKKLKDEYLLVASLQVPNPLQLYRKRWEIECFFKKIKTAGFNLESTHIKSLTRLKSLILLCAMAHLICTLFGIFRHHCIRPMKFKKSLNCYQFSFFRYGLDWITELILYPQNIPSKPMQNLLDYSHVG